MCFMVSWKWRWGCSFVVSLRIIGIHLKYTTQHFKKIMDFTFLPPPLSFFFSLFLSFLLLYLPLPFSFFWWPIKGQKEKKNKNKEKQSFALGLPSVWPLLCFVCISFFLIFPIVFHTTILVDIALYRCRIIRWGRSLLWWRRVCSWNRLSHLPMDIPQGPAGPEGLPGL